MKLKKVFLIVAVFFLATLFGLCTNESQAASSSYNLGIQLVRESGYGYKIIPSASSPYGKIVWKVVSYANDGAIQSQTPNTSTAIYCITAEQGFAMGDGSIPTDTVLYQTSYNMKTQRTEIVSKFSGISVFNSLTNTNYNSLLWLADNIYLPNQSSAAERKALLEDAGIDVDTTTLTNDDIEVIQQLAMWYFTNNSDANYNDTSLLTLMLTTDGINYDSMANLFNTYVSGWLVEIGKWRQEDAELLYSYLITQATSSTTYTGDNKTKVTFFTTSEADYMNQQPVIIIERENQEFDLSLRKFITAINGVDLTTSRVPVVDTTGIAAGTSKTAIYNHSKTPVTIRQGDIVTYTIRVYNEGDISGYVDKIIDYLPEELEYLVDDPTNQEYRWLYEDASLRVLSTDYLSKANELTAGEYLLDAYDGGTTLDYLDVKINLKVSDNVDLSGAKITNIAEIAECSDEDGDPITDRDSTPDDVVIPSDSNLPSYKDSEINQGLTYIPGQEDDDDFEKLVVEVFDLALRKFITAVDNTSVDSRYPVVTMGSDGNLVYTHTKTPVGVVTGNLVTYTIRVYNEGDIAGYAKEITDDIPEGLKYVEDNATNIEYRWNLSSDGTKVTTDYLSKEQEASAGENLLNAFDKTAGITNTNPDYKDVKIVFEVIEPNTSDRILVNTAEISNDADADGNEVDDIDSTPGNNVDGEDDIDKEYVELIYFDLALRKFITGVDNTSINNRYPSLSLDADGKIVYTHTKVPVEVQNSNVVIYTIRIYNEGKIAGYASEVTDYIPDGLEYLPDHDTNIKYGWTISVGTNIVTTDYLSKDNESYAGENLIERFYASQALSDTNPDYRDVQIALLVTEPNTSDRILTNIAEISADTDKDGNEIDDIDSTPNNKVVGEDDIDEDHVYVRYFDLALKKWVSKVTVTDDGKTTSTSTGHTGDENPEPAVKVEIPAKSLKTIVVKFTYKIKITNEGEIAGYAKEIKDHIPEGLKFVQADNPDWYEVEDGIVATRALENRLLLPGESDTVEIVLTWINGENNMGLKTNTAEISEDYNDSDSPDIDSTPDNWDPDRPFEDDEDDAPVILSVKTGELAEITRYGGLITLVITILGTGVVLIKRFVL